VYINIGSKKHRFSFLFEQILPFTKKVSYTLWLSTWKYCIALSWRWNP